MSEPEVLYVGIEPNAGIMPLVFAAVNRQLELIALKTGEIDDVVDFLGKHENVIAAINAPSGLNRGVVRSRLQSELSEQHQLRGVDLRQAEFELKRRGVNITGTPSHVDHCPAWMQVGFDLYKRLKELKFQSYSNGSAGHKFLETNPHACFFMLLNRNPLPKQSLEGRLQRQMILHYCGLKITDPMEFFEELTSYKLLLGDLPMDMIFPAEHLDALAAAYVSWLTGNDSEQLQKLGDPAEGEIYFPKPRFQGHS